MSRLLTATGCVLLTAIAAVATVQRGEPHRAAPAPSADHSDLHRAGATDQLRHATAARHDLERELAAAQRQLDAIEQEGPLPPLPARERWRRSSGWQLPLARTLAVIDLGGGAAIAADELGALHRLQDGRGKPVRSDSPWTLPANGKLRAVGLTRSGGQLLAVNEGQWLIAGPGGAPLRLADRPRPILDAVAIDDGFLLADGNEAWTRSGDRDRPLHLPAIKPARLARAGEVIVIAGDGGIVRLEPGQRVPAAQHLLDAARPSLRSLACSEAAGLIAVGLDDGGIVLHRLDDLRPVAQLQRHLHPVGHLFFSHDGRYLVSLPGTTYNPRISAPARCIVWHLPSLRMEALLHPGGRTTTAADFDPERDLLAIAVGRDVRILALPSAEQVGRFRIDGKQVPQSLAFGDDGQLLVGSNGGLISRWRAEPMDATDAVGGVERRQGAAEDLPPAADLTDF